jgi:opacity protein-like surface antigen
MKRKCLFIAALAGALPGPAIAAMAEETNHWSFDAVPYLWVASADVQTTLPSVPPSTPAGVDRFDTRISAGAMLAAQARYRSVGLFADFDWLQLNSVASQPGPEYSAVDLKSDFIFSTAALTYSLPLSGRFHADALAGAQIWNVNENLEFTAGALPGFTTSNEKTWVDPVIGGDLRYDLSKRWFLTAKGTVGGFGVSSDILWQAFGGVGFNITDWCSATVGYRYLQDEYDRNHFKFNLDAHGLLLGVGFHF